MTTHIATPASRKRRESTPEQKAAAKARREAMLALGKRAAELAKSQTPPVIVKLNGQPFSPCNSWLIALSARKDQPFPSTLASFHDWLKAGRVVRKGERGYSVWVPIMFAKGAPETKADPGDESDSGSGKRGFTAGYVFDVTQTDPLEPKAVLNAKRPA